MFFFFSSRRRHTRSLRDWSSDVCSSDLRKEAIGLRFGPFPPDRRATSCLRPHARSMTFPCLLVRKNETTFRGGVVHPIDNEVGCRTLLTDGQAEWYNSSRSSHLLHL